MALRQILQKSKFFSARSFASLNVPSAVSIPWLRAHQPAVKIIDGSWNFQGNAYEKYRQLRLPGALFMDLDKCVASGGPYELPHTFPTADIFAEYVSNMGISNNDPIVVYDAENGVFSAPRVWYMFRAFGHNNIGVLKGGINKWLEQGLETHNDSHPLPRPTKSKFTAKFNDKFVRSAEYVLENVKTRRDKVLDARAAGRFEGTAPEPRPHLVSGHVPGAASLHYLQLLDQQTGEIKTEKELKELFKSRGVDVTDQNQHVVTYCGSGITGCSLLYGLHMTGFDNASLYDGSWSEWGIPQLKLPIEK
eukprot:TRINITY_DN4694_c0_g1_i5.p1 TRINITY_DN4694_c0_g1~~TRINITY_DN4694_c0_g1_i5.p1  ORF type:complete len:323 (+),score=104.79 TRINITY_DN4694_c0_g1_i5:53-970(+)